MNREVFGFHNVQYFDYRENSLKGPVNIMVKNGKMYFTEMQDYMRDASELIMMPSFAQLHVHLCQHLYKGIAEDLPLYDWLSRHILPYEMNHTPASLRLSSELALYELIDSGTTAIMDMGTFRHQEEIFCAMDKSGIRGYSGNVLMDREIGPFHNKLNAYESYSRDLIESMEQWGFIGYALNPRFLPGITEEGMKTVRDMQDKYGLIIHTHASETEYEVEFSRKTFNMDNIEVMSKYGLLNEKTIIAHVIHISDNEMQLLLDKNVNIAHCPSANMKLGSGIARMSRMMEIGINAGIGTDGAPCNNTHSQIHEMRLTGLLQKVQFGSETMKSENIIKAATFNGFKAMGYHNAGIIQDGSDADFILLDRNNVHSSLFEVNPHSALLYSADRNDVKWVVGNGRILKENGKVCVFDREILIQQRKRYLKDLFPDRF